MGFLAVVFERMQWRTRLAVLALIVGLLTGCVCAGYTLIMEVLIDHVWKEPLPEKFLNTFGSFLPSWAYIIIVCTTLGTLSGFVIRLMGPPLLNLPGTVKEIYETGCIDHEDAPRMFVVSLVNILGAGSLGPEAPLVAIGGGLASLIAAVVEVTPAETLFITMSGMASGLAAFFGEPVGGAIFACEVIHRWGAEYYEAFIPTVIAGVSCNMVFRMLLDIPQEAIWAVPEYGMMTPNALTSLWGVPLGLFGGAMGWLWIEGRNAGFRMMERNGIGPRHVLKGTVAGLLIGLVGALAPETLFWAENEAQRIIDAGETPLPNLSPHLAVGMLGEFDLTNPWVLIFIGVLKMFIIGVTVLGGYRGGFIFPFFFAGMCFGCAFARISYEGLSPEDHARFGLHFAGAALGCAAAINASITRTVLATPIVLITLSSRPDVFPCVLIASVVSMYVTSETSIISAARKRYTREQLGADHLSDCWSDLTDKVTISRWRKGGQGVTFKRDTTRQRKWNEGSDGTVQKSGLKGLRSRGERGSHETTTSWQTGMDTPTMSMVLTDPGKTKWLSRLLDQLDKVKETADDNTVAAMNAVLGPLKDELSLMGALSQAVSAANSRCSTPRMSKEVYSPTEASREKFKLASQVQQGAAKRVSEGNESEGTGSAEPTPHVSATPSQNTSCRQGFSPNGTRPPANPTESPGSSIHRGTAMDAPNPSLQSILRERDPSLPLAIPVPVPTSQSPAPARSSGNGKRNTSPTAML